MSEKLTERVAHIVRDAGGRVVGRTKLQKLAYFLVAAGLEPSIPFVYKHYGPYSEPLAAATRDAHLLRLLNERDEIAGWGGGYSVYSTTGQPRQDVSAARIELAGIAAVADSVELELAATALFLAKEEGCNHAWQETERRKPEKADGGRLARAQELYRRLAAVQSPVRLPPLQ